MREIVIIGAGGHAQVVADILFAMQASGSAVKPIGFLDDSDDIQGKEMMGLRVIGKSGSIHEIAPDGYVVAIGNNRVRKKIFTKLRDEGFSPFSAIHPSTVISSFVELGEGVQICAGVVVNPGARVGENVILNTMSSVDHHNRIGAHTHIAPGVRLGGDVSVGECTLIGINATVMPQKSVGDFVTVGAGACVCSDILSERTVVGIPAKEIS